MPGRSSMTTHACWGETRRTRDGSRHWRRERRLVAGLLAGLLVSWLGAAEGDAPLADDVDSTASAPAADAAEGEPSAPAPTSADTTERTKPPANRKPILLKAVPAEYPKEFVGSGLDADVVVTMLVDRMGRASHIRVEGSPDPAFTDAALQALAQYEFLPAIKNGRVTNASVQLTLPLREDIGDRALVDYQGGRIELITTTTPSGTDTPIRRIFGPRPAYPIDMLAAAKSGEVVVEFLVGEDGVPYNLKVTESTFVEFARAAEGAIALWRFSPALMGAQPVVAGLRYRLSFQSDEIPQATRDTARRLLAGDHSEFVPAKQLDVQPKVRSQIEPSAPVGNGAVDRRTHRAEVVFVVDAKGMVRLPRVLKSSDPIAGYVALAAISYWTFEPAVRDKQPVPVLVTMPFRF